MQSDINASEVRRRISKREKQLSKREKQQNACFHHYQSSVKANKQIKKKTKIAQSWSPHSSETWFSFLQRSNTRMDLVCNLANLQPADLGHSPCEAEEIGLKFLKLKRALNLSAASIIQLYIKPPPLLFSEMKRRQNKNPTTYK